MEVLFKSVINPSKNKIFCIGKNYIKHVKEMGGEKPPKNPLFF
jgi:acylpyruvate hydrolase